jgi:hypothetical protein
MRNRTKRALAAAIVAGGIGLSAAPFIGDAVASRADQPGPGDKQCIPGQQGNPQPAHKAGVCRNP